MLDHVRRKFVEAVKVAKSKIGNQIVEMIDRLYCLEHEWADKDHIERLSLRRTNSLPIVEAIKDKLQSCKNKVLPQSVVGKAISYSINEWPFLIKYLNDGQLRISNILVENAIRPYAIGRKNWLFADTVDGANANCTFYTLIETAKANGLDPAYYIKYLFTNLAKCKTLTDYQALLPVSGYFKEIWPNVH
ncbi:MAG: transposase [Oligoflexia bacterium]|nr:transposase [Oligoflexia bacterium]